MKIKSKSIIATRNILSKDISHYWKIIRSENVVNKGTIRNYNLITVLKEIHEKAKKRTTVKLFVQALNMGYTNIKSLVENTNYETLYTLSEKTEELVQLEIIGNILNAATKKNGKKNNSNAVFNAVKIRTMIKNIKLEINALTKKLEEFNENTELEIDDSYGYLFAA